MTKPCAGRQSLDDMKVVYVVLDFNFEEIHHSVELDSIGEDSRSYSIVHTSPGCDENKE
jgi:hypothetical protein